MKMKNNDKLEVTSAVIGTNDIDAVMELLNGDGNSHVGVIDLGKELDVDEIDLEKAIKVLEKLDDIVNSKNFEPISLAKVKGKLSLSTMEWIATTALLTTYEPDDNFEEIREVIEKTRKKIMRRVQKEDTMVDTSNKISIKLNLEQIMALEVTSRDLMGLMKENSVINSLSRLAGHEIGHSVPSYMINMLEKINSKCDKKINKLVKKTIVDFIKQEIARED